MIHTIGELGLLALAVRLLEKIVEHAVLEKTLHLLGRLIGRTGLLKLGRRLLRLR
jgi:hypothetical protein